MKKKIAKIFFSVIIFIILMYSITILIQKIIWKDKIPNVFGYKIFIVLSGSMEPAIEVGDIVFVKQTEDIKEQDIISFDENDSVITHRVTQIVEDENNNKMYLTKGDANSLEDEGKVSSDRIEGKYCFKINKVGKAILFLRSKIGIVILVIILLLCLNNIKVKRKEEN